MKSMTDTMVNQDKHILVVGAGISGLTTAFYLQQAGFTVTLWEKEARAGGKLGSSQQDGFLFDHAANGFLSNAPETLALVQELGLNDALVPAQDSAKKRHIYRNGALKVVPSSPPAFLRSALLNPLAKMRALSELLWQPSPYQQEETVYAFIRRHFGKDAADVLAQIAVQGITAGDAQQLSLDALFPRMRQLEQDHGSILRAMQHTAKIAKEKGQRTRLTSFKGGMQQLIDALVLKLGDSLRVATAVEKVEKVARGYRIHSSQAQPIHADALVLATPSFVSGAMLQQIAGLEAVGETLETIPYAPVYVYQLGYHRVDVPHALDSFGYLVSREKRQKVRSLGVLFSSSIYPQRAPENHVALRVIAGGVPDSSLADVTEKERWQVICDDMRISLGVTAEPVYKAVQHWQRAIPQYQLGHRAKVDVAVMAAAQQGMYLTGNALYGVAVNDCIRDAHRVVQALLQPTAKGQADAGCQNSSK